MVAKLVDAMAEHWADVWAVSKVVMLVVVTDDVKVGLWIKVRIVAG